MARTRHLSLLAGCSVVLFALMGATEGARTLQQEGPGCIADYPGQDLPGNGIQRFVEKPDLAACMDECKATPGCNAVSYNRNNKKCYLKSVDVDNVKKVSKKQFDAQIITCDPPEGCSFVDFSGQDIRGPGLDGSGETTPDLAACMDKCQELKGCNAVSHNRNNKKCFLKTVDVENVNKVSKKQYDAQIMICDSGSPPGDGGSPSGDGPSDLAAFFAADSCPAVPRLLPAGVKWTGKRPPKKVRPAYEGANPVQELTSAGLLELNYRLIQNGDTVCTAPGKPQFVVGGELVLKKGGQCQPFPRTTSGGPCCTIYMWQPDEQGYYKDACSISIQPDVNGVYYWRSFQPGDEDNVGWGPDDAPHFHVDIRCSGCAPTSAVGSGNYQKVTKFYVDRVFNGGGVTEAEHLAVKGKYNQEVTYTHNIVLPA